MEDLSQSSKPSRKAVFKRSRKAFLIKKLLTFIPLKWDPHPQLYVSHSDQVDAETGPGGKDAQEKAVGYMKKSLDFQILFSIDSIFRKLILRIWIENSENLLFFLWNISKMVW